MTKILITGGAGFIASSLADKLLLNNNNQVVLVDNLLTGKKSNLPSFSSNCKFIECDVNNLHELSQIMHLYSFDYVFHYAAVVGVEHTLKYPKMVWDDIKGVKNILDLCIETGVKKIFYASSSEVYGQSKEFPQTELSSTLNGGQPYAEVKKYGEDFMKLFYERFGLEYTILRFFNTYGSKQSNDFVIAKFIELARSNEDIPIYGNGLQTRTFCYIDDNIQTTLNIFYKHLANNQVVNIGSDVEITIRELAKLIIKLTNSQSKIIFKSPVNLESMKRRQPCNKKMKSVLGKELIQLQDGIEQLLGVETEA